MRREIPEYDLEASSYDKSRFCSRLGKHIDRMHKRIVESLLNSSGKTLLDIGVGTGRFATWLAERGFEVVGVDISREMLKKAKKKVSNSKNIHLVLGDANFLPFRKRSFDNCICINVINHIPLVDKFLKEVSYVIKPMGSFIVNFPNLRSPYLPIAIIVNLRKRALFKREIFCRWFTPEEISHRISSAGFNIKNIRGCMISSSIPLGNRLLKIVRIINFLFENSKFKLFSGSLFIKAQRATKTSFSAS